VDCVVNGCEQVAEHEVVVFFAPLSVAYSVCAKHYPAIMRGACFAESVDPTKGLTGARQVP
jgi:hypothetical protein